MDMIGVFIFLLLSVMYVNFGLHAADGLDESKNIKRITVMVWPVLLLLGWILTLQEK